ncbi:MAG: TIGR03790 family protein [Thermoplasmata archaeon]|nr:TIGR03790 family protein [Thermoplasmata archaeon]
MEGLGGHGNRVLILTVLFSLLLASGSSGVLLTSEQDSAFQGDDGLSDDTGETRQGVDPIQLSRYNQLFDYSDVLVIRNINSPISMEIADYFVRKRNIPPENICNVSISSNEVIDRSTFNNLMNQIITNMTFHGLLTKINIIVTTKGVPLKITPTLFIETRASVDTELALINGIYDGNIGNRWWMANPYFNSTQRHSQQTDQLYVVTRLTGYTPEDAKGLVDRATRSIGKRGRFVLDVDPRRDGSPGYKVGNDWMRIAYDILTSRGFQVFMDLNNTFVNNQSTLAGYSSWGSNDGNWYIPENTNTGFETDANADNIPDDWFKTDNPGLSQVIRSNFEPASGTWAVLMNRTQANLNYTSISQNVSIIPERRYVLMGSANLTNVSADKGVHLQIKSYHSNGTLLNTWNGSARTGTTPNYVGLGQIVYEPQANASKLNVSAIFSQSSGIVFLDNVRLIEIKPHNIWVDGALAETYVSTGGRSFRYPTAYGQSLVADLIKDGISGVKGYVYEPYLGAVAHPNILFERYTKGWALGESFFAASEIGTSWMDLILGDPKVAPYNASFLPDLAVTQGNFTISNDEIMIGSNVSISAVIENRGNFPTANATISLFMGIPSSGGVPFMNISRTVDYQNSTRVDFSWEASGFRGNYDICVFVDPNDEFVELDEQNNVVCQQVRISDGIYLSKGWNLISLPFEPFDTTLSEALKNISGMYDMVRFYDPSDPTDHWKTYSSFKPTAFNDLKWIDRKMGIWIHLLNATVLRTNGTYFRSTQIDLLAGWNLIGYPSLNDMSVQDVFAGLPLLRIEVFDGGADPYLLKPLDNTSYLSPGKGLWVNMAADCTLTVNG